MAFFALPRAAALCVGAASALYRRDMATRALPLVRSTTADPLLVARWLWGVAALVLAIVIIGGITRLTESGLSITEWNLVMGALPPLSEAAWQAEFEKYKRIPEYLLLNRGMTLEQFQWIYFWEWAHRNLGRVIGLAMLLPMIALWVTGRIPSGYHARVAALFALVCLQGAIGWWMVSSGLAERTDVSHFRLAAHLLTALIILGGLVWTALDLSALARNPAARPARLTPMAGAVIAVLFVQLLLGAWTAGLNAGLASDSWPLMQGRFVPEVDWSAGVLHLIAWDPFLIHWAHRWWAFVAVAALSVLARAARRAGSRPASIAIHSAFGIQILLGIATVVSGVDIVLAVLHQATGALLVIATVWGAHRVGWSRSR